MTIKPEADREFFGSRSRQREIANRLDEGFDITHGAIHGELFFWLANPKHHTKERFGLNQEVLVIYSPHPKTDARVLTAIDSVARMQAFRHRIEKILTLVVHNGAKADEEVFKTHPDRVIVPFSAEELTGPSRGGAFVRSRIAQAIGSLDLFGMSSPIKSDEYFFGRDDIVQALIARTTTHRENSGLFGLRKTGKTSVLFAMNRSISDPDVVTVYIDCQNPGWHGGRWWQVLDRIMNRCRAELNHERRNRMPERESYEATSAGHVFSNEVRALLSGGIRQLIIEFDEVEYMTHGLSGALGKHWDTDFVPFWQTIRSVHQETGGGISFIVAGVNPACVATSHFGATPNPIFQLAPPQYLEPLTTPKVREMIRTIGRYAGLQFDEDAYSYLQHTYGGHPYLIRIACSEVWKASDINNPEKRIEIGVACFDHLKPQIRARLEQPIKDILLSLVWWYPDEYDLLRMLAAGEKEFVRQYLDQETQAIVQFAKYGLLHSDSGEFAMEDVREFLKKHGEEYKRAISPFTRTDMPPEMLPEIPDLPTLAKLFEKRCDLEIKMRAVILLYLGVKHAFDSQAMSRAIAKSLPRRPERPDPAELFVGRAVQDSLNELYTSDLKAVTMENWGVFGTLFDGQKSRFEMNMDTINRARRAEAHTKPFSTQEAEEFDNSYTWLITRLSRVPIPRS